MTRNMYSSLPHVSSSSVVSNIFRLIKTVVLYLFGWFSVLLFLSVFCIGLQIILIKIRVENGTEDSVGHI
jgi:hypothetical protein